ncbi:MAG: biopolymer transporter ExbD [Myxococcota bacterium]
MRRRHTRPQRKPTELMLVPMIDIFTVLVTFLLMTAVFSRITILELDLPSSASQGVSSPVFRLEVIVRKEGLELTNGTQRIAVLPNQNGAYALKTLSELALSLKRDYPNATAASVLLEPEIEYDHLIQVMDAIRTAEVPAAQETKPEAGDANAPPAEVQKAEDSKPVRLALFTDIAVGDAP